MRSASSAKRQKTRARPLKRPLHCAVSLNDSSRKRLKRCKRREKLNSPLRKNWTPILAEKPRTTSLTWRTVYEVSFSIVYLMSYRCKVIFSALQAETQACRLKTTENNESNSLSQQSLNSMASAIGVIFFTDI